MDKVYYNAYDITQKFVVKLTTEEGASPNGDNETPDTSRRRISLNVVPKQLSFDPEAARADIDELLDIVRIQNGLFEWKNPWGTTVTKGYAKVTSPANLPLDFLYIPSEFTITFDIVIRDPNTGASVIIDLAPTIVTWSAYAFPKVKGVQFSKNYVRQHVRQSKPDYSVERVTITGKIDENGLTPAARRAANIAKKEEIRALTDGTLPPALLVYGSYSRLAKAVSFDFRQTNHLEGGYYTISFDALPAPDDDNIHEFHCMLTIHPSVPRIPMHAICGIDGEYEQPSTGFTGHRKGISGYIFAVTEADALAKVDSVEPAGGAEEFGSVWQPDLSFDPAIDPTFGKWTFSRMKKYSTTYFVS